MNDSLEIFWFLAGVQTLGFNSWSVLLLSALDDLECRNYMKDVNGHS